ncbi:MAG: hypothetical protein SGI72_03815 [Planctomycetota bacterium]|nr:hypothetical protein [Planctomycetota bacterium]
MQKTIVAMLALAFTLPAFATRTVELPYEKIARDFALAHDLKDAAPETIQYEDVLAKHFVKLELGAFDVRFPREQLATNADRFKTCAQSLVAAQEEFLDWLGATAADKVLREDLKTLNGWVKAWKPASLARGKSGEETDVFKLVGANDAQIAASKHVYDALAKGLALGPAREKPLQPRLILLPTRKLFTEFIYFTGWIKSDQRGIFWLDTVPDWTQCFVVEDQVMALEYGVPNRQPTDYTSGTSMDELLLQQVAQLGMNSLFSAHYKERVPGAFIAGLSMNLVIDAYGAVQTRIDGDTRSKVTGKRDVFVAGGASEGGFLAKNSAETKWRENGGRDHFIPTLRAAQEDAVKIAKDVKNKIAVFAIRSDDGGDKWPAVAPFFDANADAPSPAAKFQGDFAEFIRAYKSAFIFWLQTKSQGTEKNSREKFAVLLKKLSDPNLAADFEGVFGEVYDGAKLSGAGADKESLEGKFLVWLSQQK